ncbi:MAG: PASTA domain-containing protein [Paludibacteraceae bacterium]|nr:PASTA domain-containing protein [Paludibacteraceae bacterium]
MKKNTIKEAFSFIFSKVFLKHFLAGVGAFLLLFFLILFGLRFYTNHGESVKVPDLHNMKIAQVGPILSELDLKYEIVDSVYNPNAAPGSVIEQTPIAGERIKTGRTIYLAINAQSKPLISVPDVADLSLRNAQATLESLGFQVVSIQRVPSEYRDLAVGVKTVMGQNLSAGSKIEVGSKLVLVVGSSSEGIDGVAVEVDESAEGEVEFGAPASQSEPNRMSGSGKDIEEFF